MEELRRQNPGKVPIHIVEKRAYIWEPEDSAFVRREHHICGLLSGTLPLIPQQNVFLGLPLQLFNEEVVHLIRSDAAFLVDDSSSHLIPTSSQANSFWKSHDSDVSSQQIRSLKASKEAARVFEEKLSSTGSGKLSKTSKKKSSFSNANGLEVEEDDEEEEEEEERSRKEEIKIRKAKEALEKRKKREELKRLKEEEQKRKDGIEELELFRHHEDEEDDEKEGNENNESILISKTNFQDQDSRKKSQEDGNLLIPNAESIRSMPSFKRSSSTHKTEEEEALALAYSYSTPGSSTKSDWYQPSSSSTQEGSKPTAYLTLSEASKAGIWNFPANRRDRATCAVFEALHSKGYYMGVGLRFGGDFVVYPGDPLRYHSHFTATVQTSTNSMVSTLELIASGRLGTAVKKAHLLCGVSLSHKDEDSHDDSQDQNETRNIIESGEMDQKNSVDENSSRNWGRVTFYSLTWAGFGT